MFFNEEEHPVLRGNIYFIQPMNVTGSEQKAGRPAVIVSNNANNLHSSVVEICYFTLQEKSPLPTHVKLESGPCCGSLVLCEQVTSISKERIGDFIGRIPQEYMQKINLALSISIGIDGMMNRENLNNIAKAEAYKFYYEQLLDKLIKGNKAIVKE